MDNVKKGEYQTSIGTAVSHEEFAVRAAEVYSAQDNQKILIQEVALLAAAAYLKKPPKGEEDNGSSDYGRPRQIESFLTGLWRCGGVDVACLSDWYMKLINVRITFDPTGSQPVKVQKAKKGEEPKRLYSGQARKWWTSKKATPVATVHTVEMAIRTIQKLADSNFDGVATPLAPKFARDLLAVPGVQDLITASKTADDEFIKNAKTGLEKDDKKGFVAAVKAAAA